MTLVYEKLDSPIKEWLDRCGEALRLFQPGLDSNQLGQEGILARVLKIGDFLCLLSFLNKDIRP